eukprot:scaffold50072_cov25-Tisochrysis_lutea.AAC.1
MRVNVCIDIRRMLASSLSNECPHCSHLTHPTCIGWQRLCHTRTRWAVRLRGRKKEGAGGGILHPMLLLLLLLLLLSILIQLLQVPAGTSPTILI